MPAADDLARAAEILNGGERVAILVGQGALGASTEVREVADLLGAGVAKALLGKAVLPDEEPFVTGAIGLIGTKASWHLMQDCDTLLIVGSNMPYSDFLPEPGSARGIQIDIDGSRLGFRYPTELNLVGRQRARRCASSSRCSSARPTARGASASSAGWPTGGRSSRRAR